MNRGRWLMLVTGLAGCGVSQTQYDRAVQEAATCQQSAKDLLQKLTEATTRADKLQSALGIAQSQMTTEEQKAQLEEAKRAVVEMEGRARLQADLIARFQSSIDAGRVGISVRRGQIVLALRNDVLFETGETAVKPEGKKAIAEVAQALRGLTGKRFQVAGHTDAAPIVTERKKEFPTNWELSAARAIAVVKLLAAYGLNPGVLSAAGFGPYDPVAPNTTPEGQAKNRRIEVTLQPYVGELLSAVAAPDTAQGAAGKKP